MLHLRTQIRDAVIAHLRASGLSVGDRVHNAGRISRAFQEHDLPTVLVGVAESGVQHVTSVRPRAQRRTAVVTIDVLGDAEAAGDIDAVLDALAAEVEAALEDPSFLPRASQGWSLASTSPLYGREGVEKLYAAVTLTYPCPVTTTEGHPTLTL